MKKYRGVVIGFLIPGLLLYTIFMAVPLISSIGMSFFSGSGMTPTKFVGFANFKALFTNPTYSIRLKNAFLNNVKFFIYVFIIQNISAFILSLLLTRNFRGNTFFRRLSFFPTTLSVIVAGFLFSMFFNPTWGFVDKVLSKLGMDFLIVSWLGDPKYALLTISLVVAWQYMGVPILLFTTAIDGIDEQLIEAAQIDGVNFFGLLRYVIIPFLIPVFATISILTFIGNFTRMDVVYAMASTYGDPNYGTDVFGTLFYRSTFQQAGSGGWGVGMGATVATVMFLIVALGVIVWFVLFNYFKKKVEA